MTTKVYSFSFLKFLKTDYDDGHVTKKAHEKYGQAGYRQSKHTSLGWETWQNRKYN